MTSILWVSWSLQKVLFVLLHLVTGGVAGMVWACSERRTCNQCLANLFTRNRWNGCTSLGTEGTHPM